MTMMIFYYSDDNDDADEIS